MSPRDPLHPIPLGNYDPDYLSDGIYVSHDGEQVWLSVDREGTLEAIALDGPGLQALIHYATKVGLLK